MEVSQSHWAKHSRTSLLSMGMSSCPRSSFGYKLNLRNAAAFVCTDALLTFDSPRFALVTVYSVTVIILHKTFFFVCKWHGGIEIRLLFVKYKLQTMQSRGDSRTDTVLDG